MKKIEKETKWYEYEDLYEIMVTKENTYFESVIFKKEYGTGITMFGTECGSWEEMLEMVEAAAEEYTNTLDWTIQTLESGI